MGTGILICGLNGTGKSTLGKALAERLGFDFIDHEALCFPKAGPCGGYASPRTREEIERLLFSELGAHENFVFASVKGNGGAPLAPFLRHVVVIEAPKELRLRRVRDRSFQKFGHRMLPGGDLYEREEAFFAFAASRAENTVEEWARTLDRPIIQVDGTKPVEENIRLIQKKLRKFASNVHMSIDVLVRSD